MALYLLNYDISAAYWLCGVKICVLNHCASCAQNYKWSSLSAQIQTILVFPHFAPTPIPSHPFYIVLHEIGIWWMEFCINFGFQCVLLADESLSRSSINNYSIEKVWFFFSVWSPDGITALYKSKGKCISELRFIHDFVSRTAEPHVSSNNWGQHKGKS